MAILLLNCGSSSIKFQMIDPVTDDVLCSGLAQQIGLPHGEVEYKIGGDVHTRHQPLPDYKTALRLIADLVQQYGPSLDLVEAVGHRIVHGGPDFKAPIILDDVAIAALQDVSPLAPLHNPPALMAIEAARELLPDVPHLAVFDTAFFADLPDEAATYAIDREVAKEYKIRRYGFHGTSHAYVSRKAAETLGKDIAELKIIVCHLGNGASVSAIDGGKPVETSMGLTPLQGLVMGTRSGDIDPSVYAYLHRRADMSVDEIDTLLNKKSGLAGLSGSPDFRDLEAAMVAGDEAAKLAYDVYVHRLVGYIGSYLAILGGVDVLVFTAGVGENSSALRESVCHKLAPLGFQINELANSIRSKDARVISTKDSPVTVMVVPTNEERQMAREIVGLLDTIADADDTATDGHDQTLRDAIRARRAKLRARLER